MGNWMVDSTAGSVMSVHQRWRDGLFDWRTDAMDGLTILGNLIGAGAWKRGAKVLALGKGGEKVNCVFLGARLGTDALQGILVVESRVRDLDALMNDPSIPPEERARKMLALFAELTAVGLMTAVSIKASLGGDALTKKARFLKPDDPRVSVPDDIMEGLAQPKDGAPPVDLTRRPVVEGSTNETPHQKATLQTGVQKALSARLQPNETEFAKAYPKDGHPWKKHKIGKQQIFLVDKDGFAFKATCMSGTIQEDLIMFTNFDPAKGLPPEVAVWVGNPTSFKKSEVLHAEELFPKMFKHFEQVGNPVKKMRVELSWVNYQDAKPTYDALVKTRGKTEAAKKAVTQARSFKFLAAEGFTELIEASHDPAGELFKFVVVKPKP
jgi:hypothetical protein